jgi:hypothetical protein
MERGGPTGGEVREKVKFEKIPAGEDPKGVDPGVTEWVRVPDGADIGGVPAILKEKFPDALRPGRSISIQFRGNEVFARIVDVNQFEARARENRSDGN